MSFKLDPKKFSDYPPEPNVDGTELIPIVKDGENSSVEIQTIWDDGPGGGGGNPAGSNTQIQFNDQDDFGASPDLTWDDDTKHLSIGGNGVIEGSLEAISLRVPGVPKVPNIALDSNNINLSYLGEAEADTTGGDILLTAGAGDGVGEGGPIVISGGQGGDTAPGGAVTLDGGAGGAATGRGGDVTMNAGAASGGDSDGGSVVISAGAPTGAGRGGDVTLRADTGGVATINSIDSPNRIQVDSEGTAIYDFSSGVKATIDTGDLTEDQTLTLPDESGTIALISDIPIDSTPDATDLVKGKIQLTGGVDGDLGGSAAAVKVKRTTRFIVAPYGDTRPADYTCATADSNQTEINQAIDAATLIGGVVDLLDGDFVVSSAIIPKDYVWLRGQGMFATKISVKAGLSGSFSMIDNFSLHNADNEPTWHGGRISDMEIDGSNMDNTSEGKGIFSIKLENCVIERIYCHDTTATGIGADDYINSTIRDCIVSDCGYMNTVDITNIVYSANTFTVTAPGHGRIVDDEIVITGMTPRQYNGKYLITSITSANVFVIDTSNNAGKLQLSRDPGAATVFGRLSDFNIGHSGIGIASGAYLNESNFVTGNYCFRNQNNNIFIETNDNVVGLNAGYTVSGNFSYEAGQCGFRNTGTRNLTFTDNFDYGSLIGGQMSAFYLTKVITAASWSGGVATFTTSTAHALTMLPTPLGVTIAGMTPSAYNGTYTVTSVPSTTTFTVAITSDPGTATVFGTAYEMVHPVTGSSFKNNIFSHNVIYGYYHEPMGEDTEFIGNTIKYSQFYGAYLASGRTIFNDNRVYNNGRTGLTIPTGNITMPITDITVHDNHIFNNGTNTAATYDGIDIDCDVDTPLNHVSIRGNQIYDNQPTQTQRYGVIIRSGGSNSYISVVGNDLTRNLTAPILIQDTSDTIYVHNNIGVNPQGKSDLGDITGTVTFDSKLASYFKGRLTGNITAVMPANVVNGAIMQWVLIQDGTGGYTLTLPANAAAQESLQLSPGANAIDTITWVYDLGTTKWRVLSQSLTKQGTQNMAEAANFAFGATTGTKIGTSTAQKLAFYNSTPIVKPSGNVITALGNLGLVSSGTIAESDVTNLVSDLALKAPLASPTFTGTVTVPTPTNSTDASTKGYVDSAVTGLLDFKGSTDASANPNYPAASKGDTYVVTVAGKAGGASGKSVEVGDMYLAIADNAGGTEAAVGTSWSVLEHNLVGALLSGNNLSDLTSTSTARTNIGLGNVDNTSDATKNAATVTLTNHRVTSRIGTVASSATPTINTDNVDQFNITALAAAITSMTANLSGTPTDGQKLIIRIKDDGTARAVTHGASFGNSGVAAMITITVIGKTHTELFIWDATAALWICHYSDPVGY